MRFTLHALMSSCVSLKATVASAGNAAGTAAWGAPRRPRPIQSLAEAARGRPSSGCSKAGVVRVNVEITVSCHAGLPPKSANEHAFADLFFSLCGSMFLPLWIYVSPFADLFSQIDLQLFVPLFSCSHPLFSTALTVTAAEPRHRRPLAAPSGNATAAARRRPPWLLRPSA